MKKRKSTYNYFSSIGTIEGNTHDGSLLAFQFHCLRLKREFYGNAPIMVVYEQNYLDYKTAFLAAFWAK